MCGNPLNSKQNKKSLIENVYPIIIGPNNKEQRDKILKYVSEHDGCLAKDIVKNFEGIMGEHKVRKIIKNLENLDLIENRPKNNRDKGYFIKKENEINRLSKKINLFSKSYSSLLKQCTDNLELAKIKDKLNRDKRGSLEPEQNREGFQSIISEYHKSEKIYNRIYYFINRVNQCFNEINDLEEKVLQSSSQKSKECKGIIIAESEKIASDKNTTENIFSYHERKLGFVKTIKTSVGNINQLLPEYKNSSKKSGLLRINFWNVNVFILFTHYINFYNVMRWPYIISDNKMRNTLNTLLYEKILDINNLLNEYQSFNESVSKIIFDLIKGEQFRSFMNIHDQKYYQMMMDYQIFGLDKQIKEILTSIITVDEYENKKLVSLEEYLEEKIKYCNDNLM